ncbi:YesL family protein [Bacillus kwashiorkori]|uniref:YesL family protein n=1 Tax=Bacillus kwashiorkori TaxID=1522318 RepID=UPI0007820A14|nr:DUF624 domain-containing protein [Bacillus kwashiorkori]
MNKQVLFNRLIVTTEWITRICFSNIIWLLFNLPIIYFAFNLLVSTNPNQLITNMLFIIILSPFLFFPSTTALFGITRKWVMGELDIKLIKSFFKYYKENYIRSVIGGLLLTVLWVFLFIDYFYFSTINSPIFYLFLAVGIFMLAFTINFFSITVHYEVKLFPTLKNCFQLALGRPVHTIGIAAITIITVYISFNLPFLLLLGTGSIIAYSCFKIFNLGLNSNGENDQKDDND